MDSFNKVISFVLGLVVVLVFLAVITGRINLKNKSASTSVLTPTPIQKNSGGLFGFFNKSTPTPTPTQKPSTITVTGISENNIYKQNNQTSKTSTAKSIPATGLPTLFVPALLLGLVGGSFLRKTGKK